MENYPSNAKHPRPETNAAHEAQDPPRMEKVVTNPVSQQKKSLGRRFRDTFINGFDAKTVWSSVIHDVLIPSSRDMVYEAINQGSERILYGDNTPSRRSGKTSTGLFGSVVQYNRVGQTQQQQQHRSSLIPQTRDPRPPVSRVAQNRMDFSDFVIATRAEAEDVRARLMYALERYGQVSVGDLYDTLDISSPYTDENWGWTDLSQARITRARRGGYLLSLPQPEPLV